MFHEYYSIRSPNVKFLSLITRYIHLVTILLLLTLIWPILIPVFILPIV